MMGTARNPLQIVLLGQVRHGATTPAAKIRRERIDRARNTNHQLIGPKKRDDPAG